MKLGDIVCNLTEWAVEKPLVGRIYIFGSRVRGDHSDDSDLDIAIELDLAAANGVDESGGIATWAFETRGWADELRQRLGLNIDLYQYLRDATWSNINKALEHSSILAYVKQTFD